VTFGRFFSILRARWLAALLVLVAVVGLTLIVCLVLPQRYTATASVLVDVKPDPLTSMIYGGMNSQGIVATQVDVIQSDRVALRVVRDLRLSENPQIRAQWLEETEGKGSIETWLSELFQKSLEVTPSTALGSNIIMVSYKAPDANFASALANAFVQAFIETSLDLRVDPAKQYTSFFNSRVKEARDMLEKAQNKLSSFQKDKGIIATDERIDVENARLNELSSQLVMLQTLLSESTSRQAQVGTSADRMQEVLNNAVVSGLKASIAQAEARLQELNSRYGPNHPSVVEANASLAELRSRINAEISRVTGGVAVSNTINRQRESELRGLLEAQRAKVLRLKAVRDEGAVLDRDVESAQRAYDAVQTRYTTSSLESQQTQSNFYALSQASPPLKASFPKTGLSVLVAFFVGLLLAVATILLLELLDRRLRVGDDVIEVIGLPVIGVMPRPTSKRRLLGGRRTTTMQQRLMMRLPATGKGA
jgi:chain length determinant protein EpsF